MSPLLNICTFIMTVKYTFSSLWLFSLFDDKSESITYVAKRTVNGLSSWGSSRQNRAKWGLSREVLGSFPLQHSGCVSLVAQGLSAQGCPMYREGQLEVRQHFVVFRAQDFSWWPWSWGVEWWMLRQGTVLVLGPAESGRVRLRSGVVGRSAIWLSYGFMNYSRNVFLECAPLFQRVPFQGREWKLGEWCG